MGWKLDKNRPVGPQIGELLCVNIVRGVFSPEGRLPSVRELAVDLGVNPNTVQRSLETLEEQGLLYSVRGSGWYVCQDISLAQAELDRMRRQKTADYLNTMQALGFSMEETKNYVKEWDYE